ncbi:MAG TPA: queuosine salvage family protein [Desulfatiglandales bacterium]|nr:queuosine salvage family protein [Desulfatiglandales bacterium]
MQEILKTAHNVSQISRQVHINEEALTDFSNKLAAGPIEIPPWDLRYHFFDGSERTVFYLLLLDTLNFCFWPARKKRRWEIIYKSEDLSGYYALAASLKKAIETGIPITSAEYLAGISLDALKKILDGKGELQLMENRLHALHELGRFLLDKYDGQAIGLVEDAKNSAAELVRLLVENLSSFQDMAYYLDHKVYFCKRAQIFAADLHGAFGGKDWGCFKNIHELTAFADYKLPQVLRHLGILRYREDLAKKVDQEIYLEAGGPEEVEIRANTIWAVELIRGALSGLGKDLKSFEIDWILWNMGQQNAFKAKPYHRTVTIFY